jgi:hypothetical protein
MGSTIWTVGHSTRPLDAFLELLAPHRIEAVADVRRFPGSRRHPQYAEAALSATLAKRGIAYRWLPALGGRRRPLPDSPNVAWLNASFRGYADHIGSAVFSQGLDELLELSGRLRTTLMCAEAVWWRCHRALIADVLCVRDIEVVHILDAKQHRRASLHVGRSHRSRSAELCTGGRRGVIALRTGPRLSSILCCGRPARAGCACSSSATPTRCGRRKKSTTGAIRARYGKWNRLIIRPISRPSWLVALTSCTEATLRRQRPGTQQCSRAQGVSSGK